MNRSLTSKVHAANATLLVGRHLSAIPEFFTNDYVAHFTGQDLKGGHSALQRFLRMLHRGFSDLQVEVEILVKGKDRVAWQRTIHATHKGSFKGFPGTGRPIVWRDMVTSRFEGGLIAEDWAISDLAERLLLARRR